VDKINFNLCLQLATFDNALVCCDKAISLEPKNAKGYLRKGMILVQQGKLEQAREILISGSALDPSNKAFNTWLAKCGGSSNPTASPASAVTNKQLGQCDDTLTVLYDAHGQQGYPLVETVKTPLFTFFPVRFSRLNVAPLSLHLLPAGSRIPSSPLGFLQVACPCAGAGRWCGSPLCRGRRCRIRECGRCRRGPIRRDHWGWHADSGTCDVRFGEIGAGQGPKGTGVGTRAGRGRRPRDWCHEGRHTVQAERMRGRVPG
jgi:hypothetical protein